RRTLLLSHYKSGAHNKDYVKSNNKRHKINMLRQWPATFPLQQPVMEALETESSHEFVMP
ncbi:TPA: hypothetical protein ACJ14G_004943, partial [Klebsiella pneumoniae]